MVSAHIIIKDKNDVKQLIGIAPVNMFNGATIEKILMDFFGGHISPLPATQTYEVDLYSNTGKIKTLRGTK